MLRRFSPASGDAELLMVKLLVAAWVVSALVRSRLATPTAATLMVAAWSCPGALPIAVWLIPTRLLPVSSALAAVVLCLPFSRLAGAPLALEWNRHR